MSTALARRVSKLNVKPVCLIQPAHTRISMLLRFVAFGHFTVGIRLRVSSSVQEVSRAYCSLAFGLVFVLT